MTALSKALKHDAAPGVALILAAIFALIVENSAFRHLYDAFLTVPMAVQISEFKIDKPLLLWINDGLMAIFFFYVGLEIKRELIEGRLSSPSKAALPAIAALGGVIFPALIYVYFNMGDDVAITGWAIPAATDIAFAVGILALVGTRAPVALKIFLLAVAIIDDLAAIIIIALFYTANLSVQALLVAAVAAVGLLILNRMKVMGLTPYILVGIILWAAVLKSGVHATLAGVVTALFIPLRDPKDASHSPLIHAEHGLKPWVLFLVMPVFAFANAGIPLGGLSFSDLLSPIPLGIALGLFIGKQIGVFGFAWIAIKTKLANMPEGLGWTHLYGASLLAGVGFTMSLFIGTLAFSTPELQNAVRLGVLSGSLVSAIVGFVVLRFIAAPASSYHAEDTEESGPGFVSGKKGAAAPAE